MDPSVALASFDYLVHEHESPSLSEPCREPYQAPVRTEIKYKSWGSFDIFLHRKLLAPSTLRNVPLQTVRGAHRCHLSPRTH